ncbi:MAG: NAD(P)/FAD-dependent oxidoreductase [Solirubrobacteraceae bacterium]
MSELTDPEGERIEVGVVIVDGGPAGLACAIRLMQLLESEPVLAGSLGEVPVAVVEKGRSTGSHLLSGAMMEPSVMRRLFPDLDESAWPTYGTVEKDAVYLLPRRRALKLPRVPPPFRNHGNHVTSVAQLGRWLGQRAEEAGIHILPRDQCHDAAREGRRRAGDTHRRQGPPAHVYEVPDQALEQLAAPDTNLESKTVEVHVTPSYCIQCGAISAKGGRLTPAEGGAGANYQVT